MKIDERDGGKGLAPLTTRLTRAMNEGFEAAPVGSPSGLALTLVLDGCLVGPELNRRRLRRCRVPAAGISGGAAGERADAAQPSRSEHRAHPGACVGVVHSVAPRETLRQVIAANYTLGRGQGHPRAGPGGDRRGRGRALPAGRLGAVRRAVRDPRRGSARLRVSSPLRPQCQLLDDAFGGHGDTSNRKRLLAENQRRTARRGVLTLTGGSVTQAITSLDELPDRDRAGLISNDQ